MFFMFALIYYTSLMQDQLKRLAAAGNIASKQAATIGVHQVMIRDDNENHY